MDEDGGPVVVASRSALPSKRGSSLPWVRGAGLAERVRFATVGAGAGSTWGVKKLGRIGGGGTGGGRAREVGEGLGTSWSDRTDAAVVLVAGGARKKGGQGGGTEGGGREF